MQERWLAGRREAYAADPALEKGLGALGALGGRVDVLPQRLGRGQRLAPRLDQQPRGEARGHRPVGRVRHRLLRRVRLGHVPDELRHPAGVRRACSRRPAKSWTTMGGEEWCCGFPLMMAGQLAQARELMEHNVGRGAPARRAAGGHDLPLLPLHVEARLPGDARRGARLRRGHRRSEMLRDFLAAGRLVLRRSRSGPGSSPSTTPATSAARAGTTTSRARCCAALPGFTVVEMENNREHALCCGGGGDLETFEPALVAAVAAPAGRPGGGRGGRPPRVGLPAVRAHARQGREGAAAAHPGDGPRAARRRGGDRGGPAVKAPAPVLVAGGGPAGQRAALDLAHAGLPVLLVERGDSLGGTAAQLGTMFPLHNCLLCRGEAQHGPGCTRPDHLRRPARPAAGPTASRSGPAAGSSAVEGEPGALRAVVRREPRYVDPARCIACDLCAKACPHEMSDPFEAGLARRRAAYRPADRCVPDAYAIEKGPWCEGCREVRGRLPHRRHRPGREAADARRSPFRPWCSPRACASPTPPHRPSTATAGTRTCSPASRWSACAPPPVPVKGRVARRSDGLPPKRIAWLQCVGSRDEKHDWCSAFCCGYATRQAVLARQLLPESEAAIFMMDDRVFARGIQRDLRPAATRARHPSRALPALGAPRRPRHARRGAAGRPRRTGR